MNFQGQKLSKLWQPLGRLSILASPYFKGFFRFASLIAVLAMLMKAPVYAVEVPGLFEVELVARSESTEDRTIALKQAFYVVLDRIMVSEDISKVPVIQQMLQNVEHYVKQLQYTTLPADEYVQTDARQLRVLFDEDQILELLRKSQVSVWSEIRPQTLLWLAVDEGEGKQYYNAETMPDIASVLSLVAKIKGLPLIFPLLDIDDQQKVPVSDILNAEPQNLLSASARYEAPAVLAGKLSKKGGCWQSEWGFYFDGKIKVWNTPCQPLKQIFTSGLNGAYQILSAYYGVKPNKARGEGQ
jgi:hypothetical protein